MATCAVALFILGLFLSKNGPNHGKGKPVNSTVALAASPSLAVDPDAVGDLTGRFIFDGQVPLPRFISPAMPRTGRKLKDESVLVFGKDQAVANIIVYMYPTTAIERQPTYFYQPPVAIAIYKGRMIPRAVCVQSSQQVIVANGDDQTCELRIDESDIAPDTTIEAYNSVTLTLHRQNNNHPGFLRGIYPSWLQCFMLVSDNPYAATTDGDGRFTIKNIPVGKWQFAVAHARLKIRKVIIDGGPTEWHHSRFPLTIHSGVNSVGTVELPSESLPESG